MLRGWWFPAPERTHLGEVSLRCLHLPRQLVSLLLDCVVRPFGLQRPSLGRQDPPFRVSQLLLHLGRHCRLLAKLGAERLLSGLQFLRLAFVDLSRVSHAVTSAGVQEA